ncbi:MAG: ABC transporter permease [Bacteroidota bacterium]|nr:ABC transporter permease [Bacteroidota bacterium]
MKKIFVIAKREFLDKVKTKIFFISLFLTPIIIIGFAVTPVFLSTETISRSNVIGISGADSSTFNLLKDNVERNNAKYNFQLFTVLDVTNWHSPSSKVFADSLFKIRMIQVCINVNKSDLKSVSISHTKDIPEDKFLLIEQAINKSYLQTRLSGLNINQSKLDEIANSESKIQKNLIVLPNSDLGQILIAALSLVSLFIVIVMYTGGMYVRSFFEEKASNLLELLLSSCTSTEILLGKIAGLVLTGVFQISIWFSFFILADYFGLYSFQINSIALITFFILGFIFYTTLFVGLGSILKTEQQAQQVTIYLSILLFMPLMVLLSSITKYDFKIMDYFIYNPLTSPTAMILKINSAIYSIYDIVISIIILLASTIAMFFVLNKIFAHKMLSPK